MSQAAATITLNILSTLISDALKWVAGDLTSPLSEAIESTEKSFEGIEGVRETLRQWLQDKQVANVLSRYIEGETRRSELPIQELVNALLTKTQFYLPGHSRPTAEKIISTFLVKLRAAYLADPRIGIPHLANRNEADAQQQNIQFAKVDQQFHQLLTTFETAGGLRPALQKQFDAATSRLDVRDYPAANALFESLLQVVETAPSRERDLERRIHVNLGKISCALNDYETAVTHYRRAAELDDSSLRAAVNSSVADLLQQNPSQALRRLDEVVDGEATPSYEYWSVKVSALLSLKRFDEAIRMALSINIAGKEAHRFELLGLAYDQAEKLNEAEQAYQSALQLDPSRPEVHHLLAQVLFTPVIEYHKQPLGIGCPPNLRNNMDAAASHFESAAGLFRSQGRTLAAYEAESNLAAIRGLQGRFREASQLLEPIVASPDASANNWRSIGLAYLNVNEPAKATVALANAIAKEVDTDTELLYAQALTMSGRADEGLRFCSDRATQPITGDSLKWHLAKANALAARRQYSKAREVVSLAQQQFPNHPEVLLALAELHDTTGNHADAAVAYERALQNATGTNELRVRYQYGGFCLNRKEYSRAVQLWRPLVHRDSPSTLLDNYVAALCNSRNLGEAATIASEVKKSGARASALFADIAASVSERLDDLREAKYWLEYLCDMYKNQPQHITRLSTIELRLGHGDQAAELLDASKAGLKDAADLMSYAQAYSMLHRHRDALELGHRAVQLAVDADIHMAYVGVFLAANENVVRTPEEIATFQDVMLRFKERFPKSSQLESVQIDPQDPLAGIRERLIKHSQRVQAAVQLYEQRRLPLEMFSRFIGRDLLETWFSIVSNPNMVLTSAAGTEEEANEFLRLLSSGPGFIIEPIALFTFSFLGLLEKLAEIGDVCVAQRTLDYLHELQAKRRVGREAGTMGIVDEQFFITEITPEEREKKNAALDITTTWVESHAMTLGLKEPLRRNEKKWLRLLGVSNVATLVTANQHGLVLLTDDKMLGDLGKMNFGISYVNTQAVLSYLLRCGVLLTTEYDNAMLKLVEAGYTFTRIDEGQLFGVVIAEQFQVTARLKVVLRVLESSTTEVASGSLVVAGIIRRIYLEPLPDDIRERLSFCFLDALARHNPKMEVQRLVRRFMRQQMSPLLAYQFNQIERMLDRW